MSVSKARLIIKVLYSGVQLVDHPGNPQ